MLHNEARELLARGYGATHDAEGIAKACSVGQRTVYRSASQKRKTGSITGQTSQRGRSRPFHGGWVDTGKPDSARLFMAMAETDVFTLADSEEEGDLSFREREGYTHDGTAANEYMCNALRFFWNGG